MPLPKKVTIVEVGPRDGLENQSEIIATPTKVQFINALSESGLKVIEATSFVSPKWVPQMADSSEVMQGIARHDGIAYPALVPNLKGLENALQANVKDIAVFTAASTTFTQKNTHCTLEESLERIRAIVEAAKPHQLNIRAYISCVLGCPYEGAIDPQVVADIAAELIALGCYEVSLGDTVGVGTILGVQALMEKVIAQVPVEKLAVHFHDTYGQALPNIYAALQYGMSTIDSSVAGLGGCPYAPGAGGNVATEDVVHMLNGLGIETGVDIDKLIAAEKIVLDAIGLATRSKIALVRANEARRRAK